MDSLLDVPDDMLLERAFAVVNGKRYESAIALFTQAELAVSSARRVPRRVLYSWHNNGGAESVSR